MSSKRQKIQKGSVHNQKSSGSTQRFRVLQLIQARGAKDDAIKRVLHRVALQAGDAAIAWAVGSVNPSDTLMHVLRTNAMDTCTDLVALLQKPLDEETHRPLFLSEDDEFEDNRHERRIEQAKRIWRQHMQDVGRVKKWACQQLAVATGEFAFGRNEMNKYMSTLHREASLRQPNRPSHFDRRLPLVLWKNILRMLDLVDVLSWARVNRSTYACALQQMTTLVTAVPLHSPRANEVWFDMCQNSAVPNHVVHMTGVRLDLFPHGCRFGRLEQLEITTSYPLKQPEDVSALRWKHVVSSLPAVRSVTMPWRVFSEWPDSMTCLTLRVPTEVIFDKLGRSIESKQLTCLNQLTTLGVTIGGSACDDENPPPSIIRLSNLVSECTVRLFRTLLIHTNTVQRLRVDIDAILDDETSRMVVDDVSLNMATRLLVTDVPHARECFLDMVWEKQAPVGSRRGSQSLHFHVKNRSLRQL